MLTMTVTELPVLTLRNYTVCEHWNFQIMERINQLSTKSPSKVQPQLMGIKSTFSSWIHPKSFVLVITWIDEHKTIK